MSARIGASLPNSHLLLPRVPDQKRLARTTGERLSPFVALACVAMAVRMILS